MSTMSTQTLQYSMIVAIALTSAAGFELIARSQTVPVPKTLVGQSRNAFTVEPPTIIDEGSALLGDQGEGLPDGH
jgi:hypothetical protein